MRKTGRPTKIEAIDKEIRKKVIFELYDRGIEKARIARIFKMSVQNVWGILNNESLLTSKR